MARNFMLVGAGEGASIEEGDAPSKPEPHARRILTGAAVLTAAVMVCVFLFGRHGGGGFLAAEAGPGADVVRANAEAGTGTLEDCADYDIKEVLESNLGGYYQGPEGMVYRLSESLHNKHARDVKLWINAVTPYRSVSGHMNGIHRDFAAIHIDSGKEVTLRFHFTDMDDQPFAAKTFRIKFYDLDEAPHHRSQEYIITEGNPHTFRYNQSEVEREKLTGGIQFDATEIGSGKDNPRDASRLTRLQKQRSVVVIYHDVKQFHVTLGSKTGGHHPRAFEFDLHKSPTCHE